MSNNNINNSLTRLCMAMLMVIIITVLSMQAKAADNVTMLCRNTTTTAAVDFSSLGINISPAVPVGTVVYSGSFTVQFECALDNLQQFSQKLTSEVYFKRRMIADGALGYGLTLYTGYGGTMSNQPETIATGNIVDTFAYTSGGTIGAYTKVSLTVPFEIVRTSTSMAPSNSLPSYVNVFDVGSFTKGTDLTFKFTNIKTGIAVKDETCRVASETSQQVALGDYSASRSSGFGSAIGQTTNSVPFAIKLNCEALLSGNFNVMMQFDGTVAGNLSGAGVLALSSGSTANGVGVQLLNESQQPVALGTPFKVASYPISSALINVPLYARYYQTAGTISPGSANAVTTYTISYQ